MLIEPTRPVQASILRIFLTRMTRISADGRGKPHSLFGGAYVEALYGVFATDFSDCTDLNLWKSVKSVAKKHFDVLDVLAALRLAENL